MKIVRMNTSSFWKGEAGVKGLVEDQGETFEVNLYLGSGRVRDYSCSCSKGNSYRGMCAHGEALFAYYNQQREEASKPTVHTSSQVHTMIREYTNREVAQILAEDEAGNQAYMTKLLFVVNAALLCTHLEQCPYYGQLVDIWANADVLDQSVYADFYDCRDAADIIPFGYYAELVDPACTERRQICRD